MAVNDRKPKGLSRWLDRRVPPGVSWRTELAWGGRVLGLGALWSAMAFGNNFHSALRELRKWTAGRWVLVESRTITAFPHLLEHTMAVLLLGVLLTAPLACWHYAYYHLGSRSIYVMRRLPDRRVLWRQCLTVPLLLAAAGLLTMLALIFLYFLLFLWITPEQCLPTRIWRQLVNALGGVGR